MFKIGDSVVYPMHGAGIIQNIEEKTILDAQKQYYTMKIPYGNIMVMIPMDNLSNSGLRAIVSEEELDKVLKDILPREQVENLSPNWNRRYRENIEKLKTGDIANVADVIRSLMLLDKTKGISTGEKKLLDTAKQILYSEIMLVMSIDFESAHRLVIDQIFV